MKINAIAAARLSPEHILAWSKLQRTDSRLDSPFFRPEFTLKAAEIYGNTEVAILKAENEYVGFFPFQRERHNVGRPVAWRISDLQGIVSRNGLPLNAQQLIRKSGLRAWHFDHLLAAQAPFRPYHYIIEKSPYMDLAKGYEAYRKARRHSGSALITQAERKARKLEREVGPLRFDLNTPDNNAFEALVSWKQAQLTRRHFVDIFRFKGTVELLNLIRRTQIPEFAGLLSALYAGDHLVAVHLGMQSRGVLASCIPAYNDAYATYSPGLLLHIELAKKADEMGVKRIDLGRGFNPLKASLMSGGIDVAIGAIELGTVKRYLRSGWFKARAVVYATPLKGIPLRLYRRLRNRITATSASM